MHQQVLCTRKKMISLGSRLIACCKLAPTLATQMWRHNYVVDRNEYIIFTLSESINPWVYSLQFLFKSTNNSWRYERKCEWVFFFWTQCTVFIGLYFLVYLPVLTLNKLTWLQTTIMSNEMYWKEDNSLAERYCTLIQPTAAQSCPCWAWDGLTDIQWLIAEINCSSCTAATGMS